MADFAMQMIESQFPKYSSSPPLLYKRYVDDCFLIFENENQAEKLF